MSVDMYLGGGDISSMGLSFQKPFSVKSRTHVGSSNPLPDHTMQWDPALEIFLTARMELISVPDLQKTKLRSAIPML